MAIVSGVSFSGVKILIVDPNIHLGKILETIFRGFGTRKITHAVNAREGLEIIHRGNIDIVVTTYMMEMMDGVEFVRHMRLKGSGDKRFIPVIMLTSHTERYRIERARDAGVTEVCAKPVTAQELFRKLVQVVDLPRPFIHAETFFGPDRRRNKTRYAGTERRADAMPARA